ncbi:M15 family metallopeptidase [Oscillospiraceae bacterium 38-13]
MPQRGSAGVRALCLALMVLLSACAALPAEEESPPPVEPEVLPEVSPEPPEEAVPEPLPEPLPELPDEEFACVTDYIPGIVVELRYATQDNFTGCRIYDFSGAWLRYGTIQKLSAVQSALEEEGLGLKIWDAFRPPAAQLRLWEICPDSRYVADPGRGVSSHSRGNTVDLTLVDGQGNELEMPTGFDDFSPKADRDYSDVTPQAAENARRLEEAMTAGGFRPYFGEWWHYTDTDTYEAGEAFSPPAAENGGAAHG